MTFFKEVENASLVEDQVSALESYVPNAVIYVILYLLALPPNMLLFYMGAKKGLITSRVKYPTLGMTLANLFGLVGFLLLNIIYLLTVTNDVKLSLFTCSFLRTVFYNSSYVCYFLFPVLAIDQYLYVCQNYEMKIRTLRVIITVCFAIPMLVAFYDLFLQDVILYDFMWMYIRMSPYTNVFFFFVLAPSFFIFSFICNLLVLSSIVNRQSKTTRKQIGRSLNPRQLQQHKGIVYTYIIQAFLPLVLATPYYIANMCFMFNVEIDLQWFVIGEAIIGMHPLTNALITLVFLRPYRRAFKKICPAFEHSPWNRKEACYDSIHQDPVEPGENGHSAAVSV
ncbi:7 transmembrane receptor (rhodopsin family) domain-containing protein [Ditylenchus destructor]|nr:7 transmembrane receptor (rhodopsin family) domain-containing protein [Ditylenchus destructor]